MAEIDLAQENENKGLGALRGLSRNVWVLTLTSLLTDVSSEMLAYLLPLFLSNVLGAQTSAIGLIEGLAETINSLFKSGSGWLSDKLGQRKWLTVAGYALSTVSKPLIAFAASWPVVLAIRIVDRTGKGIRTAPRDALIADSINSQQRGLAFGLHRAGDTLGAMLGMIIALVVVLTMQSDAPKLSRETFTTLALISLIPATLAVLVLAFGAKETLAQGSNKASRGRIRDLSPRFLWFLGIVLIFTLGNSSDAFIVLRAQDRGLNVAQVLGMLITFNLIYTVISGPAGALSDRIGRRRLITFGWLAYAVIYLGFALANEGWHIWALFGLYGVYYATTEGIAKALIADLVPSEQRGTAYGLYNAAVGIMALPASFLAGILWQGISGWTGFGPGAPFIAGGLFALLALILLLVWDRQYGSTSPSQRT